MPWKVPTSMISGLGSAAEAETSAFATAAQGTKADNAVPKAGGALTGGFTATAQSDGTKTGGTYTPSPATGNMRTAVNGGAFTLAAPTLAGDYTLIIQITNNASAGAITFSGFNKADGTDDLTTTNGHDFLIFITKIGALKHAQVVPLQ
ncbi:hypothetical protein RZ532_01005 [Nitratireductor aquimarinus]|uniref:hypothetical protein n=1 Tax=Nitratireductor aquimarinus TaxID=889300 RepID=UPI00293541B1|nr:hypothetical protein [Nitratireductor aquimarinus]MDV2964539.1 hypothetical protein [Nitratireductor aquimarinus]